MLEEIKLSIYVILLIKTKISCNEDLNDDVTEAEAHQTDNATPNGINANINNNSRDKNDDILKTIDFDAYEDDDDNQASLGRQGYNKTRVSMQGNDIHTETMVIMKQIIYSVKYKVLKIDTVRQMYKHHESYQIGFISSRIKNLRRKLTNLYSTAAANKDVFDYYLLLRFYEKMVHTNVDMENHLEHLVHLNENYNEGNDMLQFGSNTQKSTKDHLEHKRAELGKSSKLEKQINSTTEKTKTHGQMEMRNDSLRYKTDEEKEAAWNKTINAENAMKLKTQQRTKKRLIPLMQQSIYAARYSIEKIEPFRKKFRITTMYHYAFIYSKLRLLRIYMMNVYSDAYYFLRQHRPNLFNTTEQVQIGLHMYEKIKHLNLDVALLYDVFVRLESKLEKEEGLTDVLKKLG